MLDLGVNSAQHPTLWCADQGAVRCKLSDEVTSPHCKSLGDRVVKRLWLSSYSCFASHVVLLTVFLSRHFNNKCDLAHYLSAICVSLKNDVCVLCLKCRHILKVSVCAKTIKLRSLNANTEVPRSEAP